jgi:hypothetical protein
MMQDLDHEVWLQTSRVEEFIDALERSAAFAQQLRNDPKSWKWLIISLHSAVQGACVCALRGHDTSGLNLLADEDRKAWLKWHKERFVNKETEPPRKRRLASLIRLFARVRDKEFIREPDTLIINKDAAHDVVLLNELRNDFVHFHLGGWSLNLQGMPRVVHHVCEIIEHLAVLHRGPYFSLDLEGVQQGNKRIRAALDRIREHVTAWAMVS